MNLTDNGVDSLIKKLYFILLMFLLNGCASFGGIERIYELPKLIFDTNKYTYSEISQIKPDETKLISSINNGDEFLIFFSKKNNSWISDNESKYYIRNGKLQETYGLEYDFEIIKFKKIDITHKAYVRFKYPSSGYLPINYAYKKLEEGELLLRTLNKTKEYELFREDFSIGLLSWSGSNYYWLDSDGDLLKLDQEINPFGDRIVISK